MIYIVKSQKKIINKEITAHENAAITKVEKMYTPSDLVQDSLTLVLSRSRTALLTLADGESLQ